MYVCVCVLYLESRPVKPLPPYPGFVLPRPHSHCRHKSGIMKIRFRVMRTTQILYFHIRIQFWHDPDCPRHPDWASLLRHCSGTDGGAVTPQWRHRGDYRAVRLLVHCLTCCYVATYVLTEANVVTTTTNPDRALKFGCKEIWFDRLRTAAWTLKLQDPSGKKGFACSVNGAPSSSLNQISFLSASADWLEPIRRSNLPSSPHKSTNHLRERSQACHPPTPPPPPR